MFQDQSALAQVAVLARERGLLKQEDFQALLAEATNSGSAAQAPGSARYEVREELGEGGMAVVYRARDRQLGRTVALKVLRESMSVSENLRHRFHREAQVMAGIAHPNVVAVYDAGEVGPSTGSGQASQMYLAMELVEGQSLAKILSERRFELRPMLELLVKAAKGVAAAHEKGIVHRDLKPANILVAKNNEPKVADFGLAHLVGSETGLTKTGSTLGTPLYMAPEQVRGDGKEVTPRTDVHALGAILYEILTGRPPFTAETMVELYAKILTEEPLAPRKTNPKLSAEVETICLKALEKGPLRRYPNAKAFAEDLRRHLEGEPILAKPVGLATRWAKKIRRRKAASALMAVLLAVALGVPAFVVVRGGVQRAEVERRVAQGQERMRAADWPGAVRAFDEAQRLAPGDRRLRALEEVARARAALGTREETRRRASRRTLPEVEPHAPASAKRERWSAEDALAAAGLEIRARGYEAEQAALTAISCDSSQGEARRILAELCLERYEDSVSRRDRAELEWWAGRARKYGGDEYRDRIEGPATLVLRTKPDGATAYLFRYEDRERRLIPLPCNPAGEPREIERASVDALPWDASEDQKRRVREGTAYPLETSAFNEVEFPLKVRPGSYLVLFRKEGYADARYPALLERGARAEAEVALVQPQEIPAGFVYVPAGGFISGRDAEAADFTGKPRKEPVPRVEGFCIARYSVTCGEYVEFLNDRSYHSASEARRRAPRLSADGAPYWKTSAEGVFSLSGWAPDEPAIGITWDDARSYAEWHTRKHGAGRWRFRLPSEEEWEKAARGADGRFFPWGDRFDAAFSATMESRPRGIAGRSSVMERVGLFPADESPYGVRDMAGVVRNWTATEGAGGATRIVKGAAWSAPSAWCRAGGRSALDWVLVNVSDGVRLAASTGSP